MDKYINLRIELADRVAVEAMLEAEETLVTKLLSDNFFVKSVVILRNNNFGHLLPDESTRQERT